MAGTIFARSWEWSSRRGQPLKSSLRQHRGAPGAALSENWAVQTLVRKAVHFDRDTQCGRPMKNSLENLTENLAENEMT